MVFLLIEKLRFAQHSVVIEVAIQRLVDINFDTCLGLYLFLCSQLEKKMAITRENGTISFSNLRSKNIANGKIGVVAASYAEKAEPFVSSNAKGVFAEKTLIEWIESARQEATSVKNLLSA